MFLPVEQAACAQALDGLTRMLRTVLEYAADPPVPPPDCAQLLEQIPPEFRPLLARKPISRTIEALFALPQPDRLAVRDAFCNDIDFDRHMDDGSYQFRRLNGEGALLLKNLCDSLYKVVQKGYPRRGAAGTEPPLFSSRLLREQYGQRNAAYGRVCPVCVREILFDKGEGENDHYFPKSRYPALALHPYNLLPVCSDCNGLRYKSGKDPVAAADKGPGELRTVYLPYLRSARKEVAFRVGEDCKISLCPGPEGDRFTQRRIDNLERLYELEERWSGVLSSVYDDLNAELRERAHQGETPQARLEAVRELLAAYAESTKDRRDFVKGVYCAWLQTKSDRALEEMLLSDSLAGAT